MIGTGRLALAGAWMPFAFMLHEVLEAPSERATRMCFLIGMLSLLILLRARRDGGDALTWFGLFCVVAGYASALADATAEYRVAAGALQFVLVATWIEHCWHDDPRARWLAVGCSVVAAAGFLLFMFTNSADGFANQWTLEARSISTRVFGTPRIEQALAVSTWAWVVMVMLWRWPPGLRRPGME